MRSGDWTPDEILLTIEAYISIFKEGAARKATITALASELNRSETSVDSAVAAVASADPPGSSGLNLTRAAGALANALLGEPNEVRRLARNIRELWNQKGP